MRVETYGNNQKIIKEEKKDEFIRRACHICHGMGLKETANGDTIDCPNRSCDNGYIKIKSNGGHK